MTSVGSRGTSSGGARIAWRALAGPAAAAFPLLAGAVYVYAKNPHNPGATYVCPLYAATGLYCPGCGGTRAAYDLMHFDVLGALSMNPLVAISIPLLVVLWVRWVLRGQGVQLREWPFPNWLGYALPAVIVLFAVLRNFGRFAGLLSP